MSKSILHRKDGTCFLCEILHNNDGHYSNVEEHHVMFGTGQRHKSEHYGLKIYLCNEHHNQTGKESVHNNRDIRLLTCEIAQRAFEAKYGHDKWMEEFYQNYIDDMEEKDDGRETGSETVQRNYRTAEKYEDGKESA